MVCTSEPMGKYPTGCSKWPSSKAAASEGARAYPLGYVEGLNDARTMLAGFFSILLECQVELRPASEELRSLAERPREAVANDTSATVGYAPLTPTERLVFQVEQFLNGPSFKKEFPDRGQDVKVLGVRTGRDLSMTVAMPFLAPLIRTESEYFKRKASAKRALTAFVKRKGGTGFSPHVFLNMLDRPGAGESRAYPTLVGTSAEAGDSSEVGRAIACAESSHSVGRPAPRVQRGKTPWLMWGRFITCWPRCWQRTSTKRYKDCKM